MYDHILIYVIVLLNLLCQLMLIWRLKNLSGTRWTFIGIATAIPLFSAVAMRCLVACGAIHGRLADQSTVEHAITQGMSLLLIAGPWITTAAAVIWSRGRKVASNPV